jgi:serine acetyltransferase
VSVRVGLRVGAIALVGMGSVVLANVPDTETWYGIPARAGRTGPKQAPAPIVTAEDADGRLNSLG